MTLKLDLYKTTANKLNEHIKEFNTVTLNDTAAQYLNGLPLTEINTATILRQHKYDKASRLPNFIEYQNAGIDFTLTIPDCTETKQALEQIVTLRDDLVNGESCSELKGLSYDKKTKQFTINQSGKAMLENATITLNKSEERAYIAILAANQALADLSPMVARKILSDKVFNGMTNELRLDVVAFYLQNN